MTVITNRPGPAPSEIARIGRRMGGDRNEVNETEGQKTELLPSSTTSVSKSGVVSNAPAATGKLGETVKPDPGTGAVSDSNLAHAQALAAKADPNGPLPAKGKPAMAHKMVGTPQGTHTPAAHPTHHGGVAGTETPPAFSQAKDNTHIDPLG